MFLGAFICRNFGNIISFVGLYPHPCTDWGEISVDFSGQNFTPIGARCPPLGTKNLKIVPECNRNTGAERDVVCLRMYYIIRYNNTYDIINSLSSV